MTVTATMRIYSIYDRCDEARARARASYALSFYKSDGAESFYRPAVN